MERERLLELLRGQGEAADAYWTALNAGAEFKIHDGKVPANDLFHIYRRRERHVTRIGLSTIGFSQAVRGLDQLGHDLIVIGQVSVAEPPYFFQLFFTEDTSAIVACLGVERRERPARDSGGSRS